MQYFKNITAFLLLAVYMLSATATKEFLKLPLLTAHYYDHIAEKEGSGLIPFLVFHYIIENGTDSDAEEDSRLPFKSAEYAATVSFISIVPPPFADSLSKPEKENEISFAVYKDLFLSSKYSAAIWQPPRYC